MTENNRPRRLRRRESQDNTAMIAMCLWDGPRTEPEIEKQFMDFGVRLGFFVAIYGEADERRREFTRELQADLEKMIRIGWVEGRAGRYALTPSGREMARLRLDRLRGMGKSIRWLLDPQTVPLVSLCAHLTLAAVKLPAALLSGSVGLLNDAADTLLDGVSSLLVLIGFRINRERAVNVLLVLLMLATGGFTLYEAARRFFIPFEPEINWFAFVAAIFSALLCAVLWGYQRYIGLRSGSVALITQSIDSRNHIIVALSVTAGLIASLLRVSLLDTLVGLAVAVLILRSAIELGIEVLRSLGRESTDLSRYKIGLLERIERFQQDQLRDWMLFLVEKERVRTREELKARALRSFGFGDNPAMRELGLDRPAEGAPKVERSLAELFERGWLAEDGRLKVTDPGKKHLSRSIAGTRRERHRLLADR
jgi:Co/Zn/Cd efflux system component